MAPIICEKPLIGEQVDLQQPRILQRDISVDFEGEWPKQSDKEKMIEEKSILIFSISSREEEEKDAYLGDTKLIRSGDAADGGGGGVVGSDGGGGKGKEGWRGLGKSNRNPSLDGKQARSCFARYRDVIAYWCLGFCNNFTYWVMITAAYDLLAPKFQDYMERSQGEDIDILHPSSEFQDNINDTITAGLENRSTVYQPMNTFTCQEQSTGTILIADTLPATALTLAAPLTMMLPINLRVLLVSALCGASYLTLGLAHPRYVFLGVALASTSRGFSDSTFLGHASYYQKNVLSMWSSGTGVATFVGPLLYSSLTTAGFDPRHALLVFLAIPVVTAVSFWCVMSRSEDFEDRGDDAEIQGEAATRLRSEKDLENDKQKMSVVIREKLRLFMRSQKYILPLSAFYFIMYLTNQGMLELVYFPSSSLTHSQQYSWSNTVRCLGTLISRSFHTVMLLPTAWIYNLMGTIVLLLVGSEAYYHYLPSEYIIFITLFVQGLIEGVAFRTTVFRIHNKTSDSDRQFSLGIFPTCLFLPALLAGFLCMPVHDYLCQNHAYKL